MRNEVETGLADVYIYHKISMHMFGGEEKNTKNCQEARL